MVPRAGRPCTVCSHTLLAEISKAIVAGGSKREIAARYGVSDAAVQRHRSNCLRLRPRAQKLAAPVKPEPSAGSVRFDPQDPKSLVETTARLVDDALGLLENAKSVNDNRTALAALREARDGLALLMRSAGMLAGDGSITIDARTQTLSLSSYSDDDLRALIAAGRAVMNGTVQSSLPASGSDASDRPA